MPKMAGPTTNGQRPTTNDRRLATDDQRPTTNDRRLATEFSADLSFAMLTIAVGAYICGVLLDRGVSARVVACWTGVIMLLPVILWAWAIRLGKTKSMSLQEGTAD